MNIHSQKSQISYPGLYTRIPFKNTFFKEKYTEKGAFFAAAQHEIEMSKIFKHIVKATDH